MPAFSFLQILLQLKEKLSEEEGVGLAIMDRLRKASGE